MCSEFNWKQEKAWRIRYESENQDNHIVWSNREDWALIPSIRAWPETYLEWKAKINPPRTRPRDPRDILVTHTEPNDASTLPKQIWQWEQELVWREKHDRTHNKFFNWKNYDEWEATFPWPEYYHQWARHAHKNYNK